MNLSPSKAFEGNEDIEEFPLGLSFWRETWASAKSMSSDTAEESMLIENWQDFKRRCHVRERTRILVPLCGASPAVTHFLRHGCQVTAVDIVDQAIEIQREKIKPVHAATERATLICGDFFQEDLGAPFEIIYDRGALIAVAPDLRATYLNKLDDMLIPRGYINLKIFHSPDSSQSGPPFPVELSEVLRSLAGYSVQFHLSKEITNSAGDLVTLETILLQKPA